MPDSRVGEKAKAATASPAAPSAHHSGPPHVKGGSFLIGEKVRYWSQRHSRWVDAHVQRVNRDPGGRLVSYDLTNKSQAALFKVRDATHPSRSPPPPPPLEGEGEAGKNMGSSQSFQEGERVEYWSSSAARWVPATVKGLNADLGVCDLDVKPRAPLGRIRKADQPPPGAAQSTADSARPSAGPKGTTPTAPLPPLSHDFKVGDKVQYWSDAKTRWIEAAVQAVREEDGGIVYDLDCKQGAPADHVRPLTAAPTLYRVNEEVEYWSISAGRWLLAKVLRLHPDVCQCDLDVKPGAPLGRVRRVAGVIAGSTPQTEEPKGRPTSSAELGKQGDAGGQDGGAPEKARKKDPAPPSQPPRESKAVTEEPQAAAAEAALPPCVGAWRSGARTLRVSQTDEGLLVDLGPQTPALVLIEAAAADKKEPWPRRWSAVRKSSSARPRDLKRPVYVLELQSAASDRLLVKQPDGEGQLEFVRARPEESAERGSPSPARERSRSPRRR